MHGEECRCTCANDGYIDWLMGRADKRPALLQPQGPVVTPPKPADNRPRLDLETLRGVMELKGDRVPADLERLTPHYSSRRTFLRLAAGGIGAFMAWQGGVTPPEVKACGGREGDPLWDWTYYISTGWFLDRREWGARAPRQAVTVLNAPPRYVVVHHTASANTSNFSQAQAINLSRAIQRWHMDNNRWIDTGQHFTVSRGGYLAEGRARSIEIELLACRPSHVLGTHVANYNSTTLGIESEGTYTSVNPNAALLWSLIPTVLTCCFYNSVRSPNVKGHRDFNATQCPGNRLYALLPYIRGWVRYFLEGGPPPS